jgi:hypothetical protein
MIECENREFKEFLRWTARARAVNLIDKQRYNALRVGKGDPA